MTILDAKLSMVAIILSFSVPITFVYGYWCSGLLLLLLPLIEGSVSTVGSKRSCSAATEKAN